MVRPFLCFLFFFSSFFLAIFTLRRIIRIGRIPRAATSSCLSLRNLVRFLVFLMACVSVDTLLHLGILNIQPILLIFHRWLFLIARDTNEQPCNHSHTATQLHVIDFFFFAIFSIVPSSFFLEFIFLTIFYILYLSTSISMRPGLDSNSVICPSLSRKKTK